MEPREAAPGEAAAGPPLAGVRVLEFAGIGPAPLCCMLLADMGAEVVRIARDGGEVSDEPIRRGRHELKLDLKAAGAAETCLEAIAAADVLIEGFRPGVMERLGLGPDIALGRNPRLIYARMTGWGQDGPLAKAAGHDINYIALTGALAAIGRPGQPSPPPLNLVGDYGGGALYLAFGVALALFERQRSGRGQVIDAAIVDGAASLMSVFLGGVVDMDRARNVLGGAAPFYRCYMCADGRQIAVGPIEPQFLAELLQRIGAEPPGDPGDPAGWPQTSCSLEALFASRTRQDWCDLLRGSDACFAPVLELDEVAQDPHIAARGTYVRRGEVVHAAPAPRLSRSAGEIRPPAADGEAVLARWRASLTG
jgi:alpha-methylacyl-CoA racemase